MLLIAGTLIAALTVQAPGAPGAAPPPPAPPADPAAATFSTGVGLLLVPVKADKTEDYEAVMQALQAAFAAATDPEPRAVAQGWRVFKAAEPDAKGNIVYVHALLPAVAGADYRPSLWLDQLLAEAPTELLAKYKETLAGAPSRLSLAEVAAMSVAPVRK